MNTSNKQAMAGGIISSHVISLDFLPQANAAPARKMGMAMPTNLKRALASRCHAAGIAVSRAQTSGSAAFNQHPPRTRPI
jgi:hypothetical protein